MAPIIVYSVQTSPRLVYVLDWIFTEVFKCTYALSSDKSGLTDLPFFISYGQQFDNAISIPDAGLLWENDVSSHSIALGQWQEIPTFYHKGPQTTIPFDLFSAVFFLLSRYEEYYDYGPDKHDRYPAKESILYRNGWLERPLVDEWLFELHSLLKEKSVPIHLQPFSFQPTYDIDIAFSFKHKGLIRTAGAIAKAVGTGNLATIKERMEVAQGRNMDPFDCFDELRDLHTQNGIMPVYFVLASLKTTPFDKNIAPMHPQMQELIRTMKEEGAVGMHPSYYSNDRSVFHKEKSALEGIISNSIHQSRQHYIRLRLPDTYYRLIDFGITDDWSMGYGSSLGFRASTGRPFFWYDLKREKATSLRIHPFCFMDSTAHYEEKLDVEAAFDRLARMTTLLLRTQSTLVTVFHNFSLGTDPEWKGWNEEYARFLSDTNKK